MRIFCLQYNPWYSLTGPKTESRWLFETLRGIEKQLPQANFKHFSSASICSDVQIQDTINYITSIINFIKEHFRTAKITAIGCDQELLDAVLLRLAELKVVAIPGDTEGNITDEKFIGTCNGWIAVVCFSEPSHFLNVLSVQPHIAQLDPHNCQIAIHAAQRLLELHPLHSHIYSLAIHPLCSHIYSLADIHFGICMICLLLLSYSQIEGKCFWCPLATSQPPLLCLQFTHVTQHPT